MLPNVPFLLVQLLWGRRAWPYPDFNIGELLIVQVHLPPSPNLLFNHLFTLCCLSRISLSLYLSLPPPFLFIMPFRAWPLPRPIEGWMRKTERTSRAPHVAGCTITCTAFTCPVSTAVAPATVAKLACPLQPTLSAMPPSLNTCELAPTAS